SPLSARLLLERAETYLEGELHHPMRREGLGDPPPATGAGAKVQTPAEAPLPHRSAHGPIGGQRRIGDARMHGTHVETTRDPAMGEGRGREQPMRRGCTFPRERGVEHLEVMHADIDPLTAEQRERDDRAPSRRSLSREPACRHADGGMIEQPERETEAIAV